MSAMQSKPLNIPFTVLDHDTVSHVVFLDDHMKIKSIFRAILWPGIIYGSFDLNGGLCGNVNA